MKRIILALLIAGTLSAGAQENSWLVYGSLSFMSTKNPDASTATNWNASPGIGYQFNDFWTVGLNVSWGQNATKDVSGVKVTDNSYLLGPFLRYGHAIGKSNVFSWYAQVNLGYLGGYTTSGGVPSYNKYTGFAGNIFPALAINVGHNMCLNFTAGGLGYNSVKADGASNSTHTFDFNLWQTVGVGFSKNFECKKHVHAHHEPGDEVHRRHMNADEDEDSSPKPKKEKRNRDDDE